MNFFVIVKWKTDKLIGIDGNKHALEVAQSEIGFDETILLMILIR